MFCLLNAMQWESLGQRTFRNADMQGLSYEKNCVRCPPPPQTAQTQLQICSGAPDSHTHTHTQTHIHIHTCTHTHTRCQFMVLARGAGGPYTTQSVEYLHSPPSSCSCAATTAAVVLPDSPVQWCTIRAMMPHCAVGAEPPERNPDRSRLGGG